MDDWVIWLIIAAVLGVGEMLSLSFFLAPFAIGALAGMVIALAGLGTVFALVAALLVSVVALTTLRPIARSHLRLPAKLRTGTAALVGREAVVLEAVTQDGGTVKLDGETWSARSYTDAEHASGERVQVLEIRGATAYVSD